MENVFLAIMNKLSQKDMWIDNKKEPENKIQYLHLCINSRKIGFAVYKLQLNTGMESFKY